ncbi:MAG TPA: hypothetical protein VMU19_15250 [Bryobacteraceae bacterium]|nr:hypothetical protein [Bryobacteraceae bacterium]
MWNAAKESWAAGEYADTADRLDDLLAKDEGEYAPRALPWALVATSGLADGYMEAADAYQKGVKANKGGAEALRREMVRYHDAATRLILRFADKFESLNKLKLEAVPLAFPFPKGSAAEVPTLATISTGRMPPAALVESALRMELDRAMILAAARAAGCPDDAAKAAALVGAANATAPRDAFQLAMARELFTMAEMFSRDKLNDLEKRAILCDRAEKALQGLPESDGSRELTDRITAAKKGMGKKS